MAETMDKEVSYLDMSDEDLLKLDPNNLPTSSDQEVTEEVKDEAKAEDTSDATAVEVADAEKEEDSAAGDDANPVADAVTEEKTEATAEVETADEGKTAEVVIDYKAEYERLMKPFKANGREIAVDNIDDAVTLMQMGANYNKKMAALKPNLKLMKMLENNGLLSEDRINFLIDVEKKSPAAIAKLVKDSGIDLMDLDTEKASSYTPKTYAVDEREIALDDVIEDIKETSTYSRTLDIVSNKWDGASKQVIASTPALLKVINDHVERGVYDIISKEVEKERVFGRLSGVSDIDAYRQVGDAIQAKGGFNHLGHQEKTTAKAPVVVQPKAKVVDDTLKDKKRAAGSVKPAVSSQVAKDFNPLALSDAEFSKLAQSKFL